MRRREDLALVTGRGRYAGDLRFPDLLYAAVCRSTSPHGVLKDVRLEGARAMAGVAGAFAAADLPEIRNVMVDAVIPDAHLAGRPVLAKARVRYMGEPVAVVVAEDPYVAVDAANAVEIDIDPLDAAGDVLAALQDGAPSLHPPHAGNVAGKMVRAYGDIDAAMAGAAVVERYRFKLARVSGGYLEPRAYCALWDEASDRWEIWSSTQWVHGVRDRIAEMLGVDGKQVRVRAENVGGGFGPKGAMYPEEVLVAALARRLRRPVQWVGTRSEDTASSMQAHGDVLDVEAGVDSDGRLLGLRAHLFHDMGAYTAPSVPLSGTIVNHMISAYRVPAFRADIDLVYTNAAPTGFIRGGGREVGNFAIERTMDRLASRLGIDPVEVRRRNVIRADEMPYDTHLPGAVYDGGDYAALLDGVTTAVDYDGLRSAGGALGVGVVLSVERTGIGAPQEARVTVQADGTAHARIGSSPGGQGHDTTFAQVVATRLGWPLDRVQVTSGDTETVERSAVTAASRSAFEVGNAAALAGAAARRRLLEMGGELLEADSADLVLTPEGIHVRGAGGRGVTLRELLREGPLEVSETFQAPPAYASACHAAVVEVDRETGSVRIVRYVIGHDSGRSINPLLLEGQLHGGYAHGLGYALFEEAVYSADGTFITPSFLDYQIPGAPEVAVVPEMVAVESQVHGNPEGFKGVGESATIPAAAAIAGAVEDALRKMGVQAAVSEIPITPERLFNLIQGT
ncbi:MAG TPA: xanthine dehydrogenase family protein molybdopterin-binding subunit [Candidatus Dormibacteraeota bacterium]|nr:xanthine dehydrogenase family protein molybdopterin-binding subunit [Candidatus Dormibacteraeota bacterium]